MKVTEKSFVSIDYVIRLPEGQTFPPDGNPETLSFCLGHGVLPRALEEAMVGMQVNESKSVHLPAAEAYGEVDEELITEVSREDFEEGVELRPGLVFETRDEDDTPVYFVVSEVKGDRVVIDFNHPLAGKDVDIEFTVKLAREATLEDLEGGCQCPACSAEKG